jgi:CRISPR/Cas system-associated protein endoribonuclease Cas2
MAKKYVIPKNVKDRKWRLKNGFQMGNSSIGCKLIFEEEAVKKWMEERY